MLEVTNLTKIFGNDTRLLPQLRSLLRLEEPPRLRAVSDVNLSVRENEIVGIVGESGCGKSTLARMIAGVISATSGSVKFSGHDLNDLNAETRKKVLLGVQMVFQDPASSLNPRIRIRDTIGNAPRYHNIVSSADVGDYVDEMLERVGLDPSIKSRFPHQFSGGQRQRISIARALAVKPRLLVCDEAVAALDVSIQAQILDLFLRIQEEFGLTYLFISHDLGVVSYLCDRVAVMYLGRIVEIGTRDQIFRDPQHPYTRALIAEVPRIRTGKRRYVGIKGEIPSPLAPPPGCPFHPRCDHAINSCKVERPRLMEIGGGRQSVACHIVKH